MVSISERLSKWAILSVQDPALLDSVKLAYVCDSGNQAFLVTKDDDVYTIGTNSLSNHLYLCIDCSIRRYYSTFAKKHWLIMEAYRIHSSATMTY